MAVATFHTRCFYASKRGLDDGAEHCWRATPRHPSPWKIETIWDRLPSRPTTRRANLGALLAKMDRIPATPLAFVPWSADDDESVQLAPTASNGMVVPASRGAARARQSGKTTSTPTTTNEKHPSKVVEAAEAAVEHAASTWADALVADEPSSSPDE